MQTETKISANWLIYQQHRLNQPSPQVQRMKAQWLVLKIGVSHHFEIYLKSLKSTSESRRRGAVTTLTHGPKKLGISLQNRIFVKKAFLAQKVHISRKGWEIHEMLYFLL